ncbi:carbohydrate-binding module family 21 protein [Chiua virens]|nr:carbohydrate-binding module family 21 protein [Chiua virens]
MSVVRCTFSDERGPGMFHSLGVLPKRIHHDNQSRMSSVFHFLQDNDNDNTSLDERPQLPTVPLFRSPSPQSLAQSPRSCAFPPRPSAPPQLPKGVTTPVLLSNGKPLKSSLKSSRSMSMPPQRNHNHKHSRVNSEPSTPISTPKTVHFPEKDDGLTTVRIYNRSASPDALNNPPNSNGDGTETDVYDPVLGRFSFPSYNLYEIDSTKSSPIPSKFSPHVNLLLESLGLAPSSSPNTATKPFLTGFILVRNLAFEKQVSVRFTLDDWETVSEVSAHYVESLSHLPSHICSMASDSTWNDSALRRGRGWDRFAFIIHLEAYAYPLSSRTLWLATRYRVNSTYPEPGSAQYGPGGEWWDNNNGTNYCVEFKLAASESACLSPRGRPRCESFSALITSRHTQPPSPMTCREHALGTMASSDPNSETPPVRQTEGRSTLLCSGVRRLNLCNYVPPAVHAKLSVSVPSESFSSNLSPPVTNPQSLSSEILGSPSEEDSPSSVSSTLSTPPVSPTIAPRVIIHEQVAMSTGLSSEDGNEDDEFRSSRYVANWDWSAPAKPPVEGLPDRHVDLSSVSVALTLPDGNGVTDSNSLLDAFVKQWCFAQGPSPTHGGDRILV